MTKCLIALLVFTGRLADAEPVAPVAMPRLTIQSRHPAEVRALAFSSRGELATAGADGTVRIWSPRDRHLLRRIETELGASIQAVAWDESGARLAVGGLEGRVYTRDGRPDGFFAGPVTHLERAEFKGRFGWLASLQTTLPKDGELGSFVWSDGKTQWRIPIRAPNKPAAPVPEGAVRHAAFGDAGRVSELGLTSFALKRGSNAKQHAFEGAGVDAVSDASTSGVVLAALRPTVLGAGDSTGADPAPPAGQVVLVDLATDERRALEPAVNATAVALSTDARRAAAVGDRLDVWLLDEKRHWNVALPAPALIGGQLHVAFSANGEVLAVALDNHVRLFESTGRDLGELGVALRTPISAWFAGGDRLVVAASDAMTVWSLPEACVLRRDPIPFASHRARFAFDLFSSAFDRVVPALDATGTLLLAVRRDLEPVFVDRRRRLGSVGARVMARPRAGDDDADAWDDDEGYEDDVDSAGSRARDGACAKGERLALVVHYRGGELPAENEWECSDRSRARVEAPWQADPEPVCVPTRASTLDGTRLHVAMPATQTPGGEWQASVGDLKRRRRAQLDGKTSPMGFRARPPQFSPDGRFVASALDVQAIAFTLPRSVGVWDVTTGRRLGRFSVTSAPRKSRADATIAGVSAFRPDAGADAWTFSPDGRRFAAAHFQSFSVWRLPESRAAAADVAVGEAITALALPAASDRIIVGTESGGVLVYDGAARIHALAGHDSPVRQIALDPSRRLAAVVTTDGAIRIVDLERGDERASLYDFSDGEYVALSPGGGYSGSWEVSDRVGFNYDAPDEFFGFEQFRKDFDRRDILRARMGGARDDLVVAAIRPPRVEIRDSRRDDAAGATLLGVEASSPTGVASLQVFVEGRRAGEPLPVAGTRWRGELRIPDTQLFAGRNSVAVVAYDGDGRAANPATIVLVGRAAGGLPRLYIVAVGISSYPALDATLVDEDRLHFPDRDAESVLKRFVEDRQSFSSVAYRRLLLNAQAGKTEILAALRGLAAMGKDDLAIVFFAGHGARIPPTARSASDDARGDMVFVTSAVRFHDGEPVAESLADDGVRWSDVEQTLEKLPGRVLVLLDACHAGLFGAQFIPPSAGLGKTLAAEHRSGVVVFAAAKGRQESLEPSRSGTIGRRLGKPGRLPDLPARGEDGSAPSAFPEHGFFTGALLEALGDPASDRNGDGGLQLSEVVDVVVRHVEDLTDGIQTPWIARQEILGDFTLVRLPASTVGAPR